MRRKRLPKSLRKFIRKEKARIRRQVLDLKKQEELITNLYLRFLKNNFNNKKNENKGNFSISDSNGNRS